MMDHASIPLARKGRPRTAVRVIMFPQAYAALMEVASSGLPVETAGLLIGSVQEQGGYTWLWVRSIEPLAMQYENLQPGFDPARVIAVRDAIASGTSPRPVGWFYSDPGMGVFAPRLNLRDVHRSFGPGLPVMLVVNPSTEQGVFLTWRGDSFVPSGGFYEALAREGAEPTIPWGGGLPSNWVTLAEGTGLAGQEDGAHGLDLDTAPDASGGSDDWTDKFDTSPFSNAPYDLPPDARVKTDSGTLNTPPRPLTIDDLMVQPGPSGTAGADHAPPALRKAVDTGPLPPLPEAEAEAEPEPEQPPAVADIAPERNEPDEARITPEIARAAPAATEPPRRDEPVVAPVVAQPQAAAPQAAAPPAGTIPAVSQTEAAPKAPPDLGIRYANIEAARTAQSAIASQPHTETRRLDDLRDYIRRIDPERPIDPDEEARWLGALRTGQLDDEGLKGEILRQKRMRRVPLSRRIAPFLLPVLLVVALGAALYYGWPAITALLQNTNRPQPTPVPVVQPPLATPEQSRTFTETGFTVSQPLLGFWRANGGLPVFGYPISERLTEQTPTGESIEVQYFERVRLEMHPEAAGRSDFVRTGPLGREAAKPGTPLAQLPEGLAGAQVLFDETNLVVPQKFYDFWQNSGAKLIFGPPVTSVLSETVGGTPMVVQYFERARFEYHPEAAGTPGEITLGLLGAEIYRQRYGGQ